MLAIFIVPLVRYFCLKKGFVDIPDERKVHSFPIPRLGGVAIWLCTLLTFVILVLLSFDYPNGHGLSGILLGGSLMFILGLVDDVYNLNPKFKLFIQLSAALVAFLLGVKIELIQNPFGSTILLGMLSLPITIIWLVAVSNAMNFIDGVDGLAGTVSTISAITLCVVALSTQPAQPIAALVAAILAGSVMGFLLFNFNPAKIFMGDSGALFAGFTLAALSVTGVLKTVAVTIILPVFILAAPIMDICFSVSRRVISKKDPFKADADHIHHKLLKAGFSHNKTVLVFITIAIATGIIATSLVGASVKYILILAAIVPLMLILSRLSQSKKLEEFQEKIAKDLDH